MSLFNSTVKVLIVRIGGAGLEFGMHVAIAKLLGVHQTGIFVIALMTTTMASVLARIGLENVIVRLTASAMATSRNTHVRPIVSRAVQLSSTVGFILSAIIFLIAPYALGWLNKPDLISPIQIMSFAILPLTWLLLYTEALKGIGKIVASQIFFSATVPVAVLIALTFAATTGDVIIGYVIAALASSIAIRLLWTRLAPESDESAHLDLNSLNLLSSGVPMLWVRSSRLAVGWAATLFLAIWATTPEVGVFGTAMRVSLSLAVLLVAVNAVIAPLFAATHTRSEPSKLRAAATNASRIMIATTTPVFVVVYLYAEFIMGVFGPDFVEQGTPVLRILAVGQLVNVATGPVSFMLMMTGQERSLQHAMTVTLFIGITFLALLVPRYGLEGAAISVATVMAIQNLSAAYLVWRKLGFVIQPISANLLVRAA